MSLFARIPSEGSSDPDETLDRFVSWVGETGIDLYPAQEEALLEIWAERHLILSTPTGSGKSLVALGLHFKALCEGRRSFYTSPTKALASEKFFSLCDDLGPERVGMLTGDASINPDAPVICCTAEVLANMALRQGEALRVPYVVMDEFHYYSDRERGVAWQVPLLEMPDTMFLLMSATLGDTSALQRRLRVHTGREVGWVHSDDRPVPLDYEYCETPIHVTVEYLLEAGKAPVYVVNFTQRECAEQAQALTSANLCSRDERDRIREVLGDFRFDSPYGKDMARFIRFGIGLHHAGLLPKYRLLVEQLSQQGLLKVICGTDTLGVGVNIPIRTVLFTKLSKFDGEKVGILTAREFKQISGRAGRKGFDERGSVVCQAPEHVIETRKLQAKKKPTKKRPPRGFVPWNRDIFEKLIQRPPEPMAPRFWVSHGTIINVLQRGGDDEGPAGDYRDLINLVNRSHGSDRNKARLRREVAVLFRSLHRAGIVKIQPDAVTGRKTVRVSDDLQSDFSLHHTLSLYLVEALSVLDPEEPGYALEVLSLVEAILEDPRAIQFQQVEKLKRELLSRLKAEGVPYEDRIRELEDVSYPQPNADFIYETFNIFAEKHPWVGAENIRPKSIAREIFDGYYSFEGYVRECNLARSEGLLLRYLSQTTNTLVQTVPETARTQEVYDALAFFRTMIREVDSSLVEEWESLIHPEALPDVARKDERRPVFDLAAHPKILTAQVRAEMHGLVRALATRDFEQAVPCVKQDPEDPWDAARFERELAPFFDEYQEIIFTPQARQNRHTLLESTGQRRWDVQQVLVDPEDDCLWCVYGTIDLGGERSPEGPLIQLRRIGT